MDLKRLRTYAAHLLGRYANLIDPDDVVQTVLMESYGGDTGGSEDMLLVHMAIVAGRLKQQERRRLQRLSSLSATISKQPNEDGLTAGDLQKAKTVDPATYIFINEVLNEAVHVCQALLKGKPHSEQKASQMGAILECFFVQGAESFAAAYEANRQNRPNGPLGRTAAYELWLNIAKNLQIRLGSFPGKGRSGERDKRRK